MLRSFIFSIILIGISLLFAASAYAQHNNVIQGRILDEETGSPILFADVYLSGTTIGSTTDEKGYFKIESVPPGLYQLVASMIGYNSLVRDVQVKENSKLEVELSLKPKVYETEQITVAGERPADWDKCYTEFRKLFLGNTKYADECRIMNPHVLSFNEEENSVTASADSAIVIENDYLGYKMICNLLEYRYDRKSQHLRYVILPRFINLIPDSSPDKIKYANHRLEVYEGSVQHFLKALINNDFISKGYKIYKRPVVDYSEIDYLRYNIDDSAVLIRKNSEGNYDLSYDGYLKVIYGTKLSWIKLEYNEVVINPNGFSNIFTPFEVRGFWASEGISTLLPTDFAGY